MYNLISDDIQNVFGGNGNCNAAMLMNVCKFDSSCAWTICGYFSELVEREAEIKTQKLIVEYMKSIEFQELVDQVVQKALNSTNNN